VPKIVILDTLGTFNFRHSGLVRSQKILTYTLFLLKGMYPGIKIRENTKPVDVSLFKPSRRQECKNKITAVSCHLNDGQLKQLLRERCNEDERRIYS